MTTAAGPETPLAGRRLILAVTGGIAAYKTADLVRLLRKAGAEVQVLMTRNAARFVTPLTLATVSGREVLVEVFPEHTPGAWTQHIELGLWADLYVVAPCTAQTAARLAHGFSDDMVTATALAARCPIVVFPAMDHDMYHHPATQANLTQLSEIGYEVVSPSFGELASGLIGDGRMPEPAEILAHVARRLHPDTRLSGKRVLVSAGPTREALDPVRYLTNHSSGTMGFALAAEAARRGAMVTLVAGPVALPTPRGVSRVDVESAEEMNQAVQAHRDADLIIMAAAVADYTPAEVSDTKIKKTGDDLVLRLRRTPDILAGLGRNRRSDQILVGFALETDNELEHATRKLESKNLDWIILNNPKEPGAGFGPGTNRVTLIHRSGTREPLPLMPKSELAGALLDRVTADLP